MPSPLTSSFASAAAGGTGEISNNRREGSGTNEWSRSRLNGAQTFRRPSTQSRDNIQATSNNPATPYVPPHMTQQPATMRNGVVGDSRYSKDELLHIYQTQKDAGFLDYNVNRYFTGPFDIADVSNGLGSKGDGKELSMGPEICWTSQSDSLPLSLVGMSDAEKQSFSSSVNSPLKMSNSKEGGSTGIGTRKTSVSHTYGNSSSSASRPGTRRRETGDSLSGNGPLSPIETKTLKNEQANNTPPALLRRRTDFKEDEVQGESNEDLGRPDNDVQSSFASLRRTGTGPPSAGINGPSSPWSVGPQSSAFGSMSAFGNFGATSTGGVDTSDKRPGFGSARGGSRLKDFLAKSTAEDASPSVKEKSSFGTLGKLAEEEDSRLVKNRPNRSETNPYDEGIPRTGSAVLSHDEQGNEQGGFSAFGAPPGTGTRDFGHSDPRTHQTPYTRAVQDAMSPTSTNPYQSPQGPRIDEDEVEEGQDAQLPQIGMQAFSGPRRDVFSSSDGRGPSNIGSMRGLGGLSTLSTWGSGSFGPGNGSRERPTVSSAFGDSLFSPISDIQTPGGSAFGSNNFFGGGFGSGNRPSRLGGLFPPAMQDQMRSDNRSDAFEGRNEPTHARDPFESANRRNDGFRGGFDEKNDGFSPQSQPISSHTPINPPGSGQRMSVGPDGGSQGGDNGQMPAAQQRQMVMPDRMRWVYRDPHGNVQGPWSGLEMHDWFKAGFFTAELQVKKLEDVEYEPLAQLVRRIGNSREPFLVPQIGVPHGPSPAGQGNPWSATGPTTGGQAQPPFASSFPSFGTTLTADQQNALERRKQEEQFLMARQKEFLAQRQVFMNQPQMPNTGHGNQPLTHQQSTHSLQSQPSFGSITSPGGYQPSPMQGPIQPPPHSGGFNTVAQTSGVPPSSRDEEMPNQFGRLGLTDRTGPSFGDSPLSGQPPQSQMMSSTFQERDRMPREISQSELQTHQSTFLGQQGRNERLEEFHDLRGNMEEEEISVGEQQQPQPVGARRVFEEHGNIKPGPIGYPGKIKSLGSETEALSLTQQVQRTAAAHKQAATEFATEPPPVSISPLPAPAAQRNRQHVADALAAESRSATQTPVESASASVAPWAEKTSDMPKVSSLKEIQEAEARRAAEQEELLAAARRAHAEHERIVAAQAPPPAPGLPSTSNWATSTSPGTPTTPGASVWAKQSTTKPVATGGVAPKKTLAQIQKEEEARKQRTATQTSTQAQLASFSATTATSTGNRYAQMAGKIAQSPSQQTPTGAWTTVGSSGKPKTPATVVAGPQTASRTISTGSVPTSTMKSSTNPVPNTKDKARDELVKWAKGQLGKGLNNGINVDDFVRNLLDFPSDIEVLSEAIYGSSQTLDGRRLAEEFIRRRKLAERGIVDPNGVPSTSEQQKSSSGGWSEVAKKGPTKEEPSTAASGFKVVSKKKGKR